ncbi:GAF domain-containing protein [Candidatus Microgenomates bacterium]|nr:MAG: GAF domain-containing protein [Candidatus Microgenomates bacterium]
MGIKLKHILESINKAALKFLEQLTVEETYKVIVLEAIKLVGADYGTVILENDGVLERVYSSNPLLHKIKIRKKGYSYKAYKNKKAFIVGVDKIAKIHPQVERMGIESVIFIPLSNNGKSIGTLSLDSLKKEHFTEKELNILKLFGSMASIAIRKAISYNETEKALESRDLFISMAAHELRTPLTTINGYAQLLNQNLSKFDPKESRWIEQLGWESFRLSQLVNELLEVNRIKTGKLNYSFRECKIKEIIKRSVNSFYFSYPNRKIILNNKLGTISDMIIGDIEKLEQVFINLLDNAAKFSSGNSEINISIESKQNYITISVRDSGKGIAKEDIPKVIRGFYKKDKDSQEGMGLGLFIIKNIIKLHKGILEVSSKINKGTVVRIKLPKIKYYVA